MSADSLPACRRLDLQTARDTTGPRLSWAADVVEFIAGQSTW